MCTCATRPDHLLRSVPFLGATGCHCPWLPCTVAPLDLSRGPGFSGRSSSIGRASSVSAGAAPRGVKAGAAAAAGSPPGPAAASTGWETAGASAAAAAARLACFASSFARSIALRASVFFRVRFGLEHRAPPPHAASPLLQHVLHLEQYRQVPPPGLQPVRRGPGGDTSRKGSPGVHSKACRLLRGPGFGHSAGARVERRDIISHARSSAARCDPCEHPKRLLRPAPDPSRVHSPPRDTCTRLKYSVTLKHYYL